jgi:two-component system nitrate/nitrite response regulator NarL
MGADVPGSKVKGEGRTGPVFLTAGLGQDRPAGIATLIIASPLSKNRSRWIHRLQATLVAYEVSARSELTHAMRVLKPDVLVLDLALPGLRRLVGLPGIQNMSPSTRILALTDAPSEDEGVSALKAGAKGYCLRTVDPEHLVKAVAALQRGEVWVSRRLIPGLVAEIRRLMKSRANEGARRARGIRLEHLTARQRVVAELIGRGASNKEIASLLNISERTVKAHVTGAFRNVGVSDRLQLALLLKDR